MSAQDTGTEATISDEKELETLRDTIDDPVVLKEQLRKESEARRQLTARAKNAEAEVKKLKEAGIRSETTVINPPPTETKVTLNDEVVELRLSGYSKKEVEWIMNNGGSKTLEDPNSLVSIAIKAQREQTKAEVAASQTSDAGQSDIERKYTKEQLAAMSIKELEAILPHA